MNAFSVFFFFFFCCGHFDADYQLCFGWLFNSFQHFHWSRSALKSMLKLQLHSALQLKPQLFEERAHKHSSRTRASSSLLLGKVWNCRFMSESLCAVVPAPACRGCWALWGQCASWPGGTTSCTVWCCWLLCWVCSSWLCSFSPYPQSSAISSSTLLDETYKLQSSDTHSLL